MTTTKHKIFLILFGLIIISFLLEISLRFTGYIYYQLRLSPQKKIAEDNKEVIKILCLGDSFTFGLGAEYGNDYPAQLERLLNKNYQNKKFIVYNRGIPGQNSSMVLKRLVHNINTYKPNIILLLIGSNNSTVLEDSNYYLFRDNKTGKIADFFSRLDISLTKLRSYKLIRLIILSLKNKFKLKIGISDVEADEVQNVDEFGEKLNKIQNESLDSKEDCLRLAEKLYKERKFSAAEKMIKEMLKNYDPKYKRVYFLLSDIYREQERYDLALAAMEEYIKNNPNDPSALLNMGRIYYLCGRRSTTAVREENFKQAARILGQSFLYIDSNDLSLKGEVYCNLAQLYNDQEKKELAIKMMEQALKCCPDNKFFRQFRKVVDEPFSDPKENEIFNKLLYYDLSRIINLCQLYNVRIILLSYPSETNSIRKEIADKYKILFIDIGFKFAELLSKCNYKDLFSNDADHPNANGYRVMAETVLETLKHEIEVSR